MKYKRSKQRDEIERFIKETHGHMSADEIFQGLKSKGSLISLATVYRNLNILTELRVINKISHPRDGYVYDKSPLVHHHLYCKTCNQIFDAHIDEDEQFIEHAQERNNMKIEAYSITFWGVCNDCLQTGPKSQ
ncbi:MAG: Fur family transcriptional regulator [Erysipelotrichaceae bacterium]